MTKCFLLHDLNMCFVQILKWYMVCTHRSSRSVDGFPFSGSNPARNADDNSQEDCLPFLLDDDSSCPEGSPSVSKRMSPMKSTYGFSLDSRIGGRDATSNVFNNVDLTSRCSSARQNLENASFRPAGINKASDENLNEPPKSIDQRSVNIRSRGTMNSIVFRFLLNNVFRSPKLYHIKGCLSLTCFLSQLYYSCGFTGFDRSRLCSCFWTPFECVIFHSKYFQTRQCTMQVRGSLSSIYLHKH